MNGQNDWLSDMDSKIGGFIDAMSEQNYSRFRYSYSGDIKINGRKPGLANSVFAAKILYTTGLLEQLSTEKKGNLTKSILKYTRDGYLYDPALTQSGFWSRLFGKEDKNTLVSAEDIRRAETRQSFAALHSLGTKPGEPFKNIPYTQEGVTEFLRSFDWSRPWNAASHFSHLLFFLHNNAQMLDFRQEEAEKLTSRAVEWVGNLQSDEDGCWYSGKNVPLYEKINGALKIFTGLHAAGITEVDYPEKIIDTALSAVNDTEACSNFNIAYILYSCNLLIPEYRLDEIKEFLLDRLDIYREFYYPDYGGFSFHRNKANEALYGKVISQGKDEPDIHGTNMFILGIAVIDKILNLGLNYKIPLN